MDEDHEYDPGPDPDPPAAAGGTGPCPCCCSSPSAAGRWRRSVKRRLEGVGDGEVGLARVEAEEEAAVLREAVAAAQETAAGLRVEVEEERLAAASAASEAMAMMLRLQREKAEVQMELRQFRRFADEKMALDAAEVDHLRALLASRARYLLRLRSRLQDYRHTCLRLGIPLPDGEEGEEQEQDDELFLAGIDGDDSGYYPELHCYNGEYYEEDGQDGEEDAVVVDLERRIYLLEHDQERNKIGPVLEEEEGAHLCTDELPEKSGREMNACYVNDVLPEEIVQERSHLYDDDDDDGELPESPAAGCGVEDIGSDSDGIGSRSSSDRVYTIDKVHQGAAAPTARVLEKHEDEAIEPDIKKLYMRLEALEADRESMRQALVAMRTEKAQLVLLREIAQQLAKDAAPAGTGVGVLPIVHQLPMKRAMGVADRRVGEDKKTTLVRAFSRVALFKWIITSICALKKKPSKSRYTFGLSSNNVGLLVLLEKCPRMQKTLMR